MNKKKVLLIFDLFSYCKAFSNIFFKHIKRPSFWLIFGIPINVDPRIKRWCFYHLPLHDVIDCFVVWCDKARKHSIFPLNGQFQYSVNCIFTYVWVKLPSIISNKFFTYGPNLHHYATYERSVFCSVYD